VGAAFLECTDKKKNPKGKNDPAALKSCWRALITKNLNVIAKAEPILTAVAPNVQNFQCSEYINALAKKRGHLRRLWVGQATPANHVIVAAKRTWCGNCYYARRGAFDLVDNMAPSGLTRPNRMGRISSEFHHGPRAQMAQIKT